MDELISTRDNSAHKKLIPTFDEVLSHYINSISGVRRYYKTENKLINNCVYSVDFSELCSYMFNSASNRNDFDLVNYIFDLNLKRDFKFTMLPPAIFELRRHYNVLFKSSSPQHLRKEPTASEEFKKLVEKLQRIDLENIEEGSKDWIEILAYYNENITKFSNFDFLAMLSSSHGTRDLFDNSHDRLINLFKRKIIVNPEEIDFLDGRIQDIRSDQNEFNKYLSLLSKDRKNNRSNIVDAEHAALNLSINQELCDDNDVMNIYTGSPIPFRVFNKNLKFEKKYNPAKYFDLNKSGNIRLCLVKCPSYIVTRTFCNNELESSGLDKLEFLDANLEVLRTIKRNKRKDEINQDAKLDFNLLLKKSLNAFKFFDIFYMNENFSSYLDQSMRVSHFNESGGLDDLITKFSKSDSEKIKIMKNIYLNSDIIANQEKFENALHEVHQDIYQKFADIYIIYMNLLKGYDPRNFTPKMQKYYEILEKPPELDQ